MIFKSSALKILGGLVIALGLLSKMLLSSRRRLKTANKQLKEDNEFKQEVMESDNEITEQTRSRTVDLANEIEANRIPTSFDANSLRKRKRKD